MGFSPAVAICFTLNYIIGSGFLTLPWAFHQTGMILGVVVMVIFMTFAIAGIFLILESTVRAEKCNQVVLERTMTMIGVNEKQKTDSKKNFGEYLSIADSQNADLFNNASAIEDDDGTKRNEEVITPLVGMDIDASHTPPLSPSSSSSSSSSSSPYKEDTLSSSSSLPSFPVIPAPSAAQFSFRKYELNEMCEIFLGSRFGNLYTAVICIYLYGTLWAYTSVFGKAFATFLPFTGVGAMYHSYLIYLGIFTCLVVPVSLMEFQEQIFVQVGLTIFRVVMLSLMVGTVLVAWYCEDNEFRGEVNDDHEIAIPSNRNFDELGLTDVKFERMYLLLPIAAYAFIFHHSVPSLSEPVEDKSKLPFIFNTALIVACISYLAIGGVISTFMGDAIRPGSNLNWETYTGRECDQIPGTLVSTAPLYAKLVSLFVVLFPALDVASAYPLNAFTLGNTLMTFTFGSKRLNRMAKEEKREEARQERMRQEEEQEREREEREMRLAGESGEGDVELSNISHSLDDNDAFFPGGGTSSSGATCSLSSSLGSSKYFCIPTSATKAKTPSISTGAVGDHASTITRRLSFFQSSSKMLTHRQLLTIFRLLAAVPPILAGCVMSDLGSITDWTGLSGFIIVLIFPPFIAKASEARCLELGIPSRTIFSNCFTSNVMHAILLVSGTLLLVTVFICLVYFRSPQVE